MKTAMIRSAFALISVFAFTLFVGCDLPGNIDADVEAGVRLYKQRKFSEAIPLLQKASEKPQAAATRSDLLTIIGNCYYELEQFDESLKYHDLAIKEDPKNHQAYVNKGVVYRLMGDFDKAAQLYSQALKLAPDFAELHASMGALAIHQDNYEAAVKHLQRAVELDDALPVAHSNLAVAYATVGRFDDAEKELKKAITRGYHQPDVIRNRIEQLRKAAGNDKNGGGE